MREKNALHSATFEWAKQQQYSKDMQRTYVLSFKFSPQNFLKWLPNNIWHIFISVMEDSMAVRTANAVWEGGLQAGKGTMQLGSGAFEGQYSFSSRFEEGAGTNPEELIGAAHAGCFSMAFAATLSRAGFEPRSIRTTAVVHLTKDESGFSIPAIDLNTEAVVPGIEATNFQELAETAKKSCPVSKALAGVKIKLTAKLI
jgi:lipoyl-dependent peroxiredoxin